MVAVLTCLNFSFVEFVYYHMLCFGYHNYRSLQASLRIFRPFSLGKETVLIYG